MLVDTTTPSFAAGCLDTGQSLIFSLGGGQCTEVVTQGGSFARAVYCFSLN